MNPPLGRPPTIGPQAADWNRIAASPRFQHLLRIKQTFIVPAFLFFVAYGAILGTLLSRERMSDSKFNELMVRANTGLGAEQAIMH